MRTIKRRRQEGRTDYKARLNLLKSGLPRVIIRKTNRYIIVQYVKSKEAQDHVIVTANSKELLKHGWPEERKGSLKSLPACYLVGLLLGKKIKEKEKKVKAILDTGLNRNVKKNRIYAVLKGLVDSEIEMAHKEEIFPDKKRLEGEHLKNKIDFDKIKNKLLEEK